MSTMSPVHLSIDSPVALVDQKITIRVTGLAPQQPITIAASVDEANSLYISHGHYEADADGTVDLTTMPSTGGSFQGVEPMGLFWGMIPAPGQRAGLRLFKSNASTPFKVQVSVQRGHIECITMEDCHGGAGLLASQAMERWYQGPGVSKVTVRDGALRGALFLPPGKKFLDSRFAVTFVIHYDIPESIWLKT